MTLFEDYIWRRHSYDLEDALALVWDNFELDWREFWGLDDDFAPEHLDPDEWEEFQRLDKLAARLGDVAQSLVRPSRLPDRTLAEPGELERDARAARERRREIIRQLEEMIPEEEFREIRWMKYSHGRGGVEARHHVFRTGMQIIAANQLLGSPDELAERMLTLLNYVTRSKNMGVQAYLGRVAECYIRGMAPEFAVMSRAVLESALEAALPPVHAWEILNQEPRPRLPLSPHIEAARIEGVLNNETEKAARRIKQAGDDVVHGLPQLTHNPQQQLEDLVVVLEHLEDSAYG